MTAHDKSLKDFAQRATAVLAHDRSLLVEAGAGSGNGLVRHAPVRSLTSSERDRSAREVKLYLSCRSEVV